MARTIDQPNAAYNARADEWQTMRDLAAGAGAVRGAGQRYLPRPSGMDEVDYRNYLARAAFFPALGRTVVSLTGAILAKPLQLEGVPADVQAQLDDVTLRDESMGDLARELVAELLTVGRCALLVEMPAATPGVAATGARPYWVLVRAEDIVDWRVGPSGADPYTLVGVVLREVITGDDGELVTRYRELALNTVDGAPAYQQRLWTRSDPKVVVDTAKTPWTAGPWVTPLRRGTPLDLIPFTFLGATGVSPTVERPPLLDLAELILSHWKVSADHSWGLHWTALPTVWVAGLREPAGEGTAAPMLRIGSGAAWELEKDGKAGMLEFTGAGLGAVREALAALERQMAVVGARLLLEAPAAQQAETATSVKLRYSGEQASLRTISGAVEAALTRCVRWHSWWWAGAGPLSIDPRVVLANDFFAIGASAQELQTALGMVQAEVISHATFWSLLQRAGWAREGVTSSQEQEAIGRSGVVFRPKSPDNAA
jgi:hypothetical protein